jgi:hypothetical protein
MSLNELGNYPFILKCPDDWGLLLLLDVSITLTLFLLRLNSLLGFSNICLMVLLLPEYSILSQRLHMKVNTSRGYQNINIFYPLGVPSRYGP